MSAERPWLLLALVPGLLALGLGAHALLRDRAYSHPVRARLVIGAQCALVALLVLAAAGLRAETTSRRLAVVLLVDRSRSTDHVPDVDRRLRALLAEAGDRSRPNDLLGVVAFAREADTALAPSPVTRGAPPSPPPSPSSRDGSDLAAAILHGLSLVPDDASGRLVLVSDGDATQGDARAAAALASAAGVAVDVVPLRRPPRVDVAAVRLRAPDRAEPGAPVDLALVTRSSRAARGHVELLRDGARVARVEAAWGAGEDVIHLRDAGLAPGLHRYEARLVPEGADDAVPGNERAAGFVRVAGSARAVVVSGDPDAAGGGAVADALRSAGLEVDLVSPASAPGTAGEWGRYDLVVLDDVRARDLDPTAAPVLREMVRELGVGLWMLGSDRAFGPGGWAGGAVEDVLPVTLDLRRHRLRGSAALALVIDRSGSMSAPARDGRAKIDLANEGAARAAATLHPTDRVAIAHVDTATTWTLRLRAADDPAAIARAARAATAGGGGIATDVGLRDAYAALRGAGTTVRHVVLLADGDDAESSETCGPLARDAAREGITTSVVAIGRGHDEPHLARIASLGGGRYYLTEDARALPAIFTEETVLAARNPLREEPFRPRPRAGVAALRGVDLGAAPTVDGYVVTEARARAEVLAEALDGDPWLARWQAGVGRAAALTSDLHGRWTRRFLAWPGASVMAAQTGLWLARGVRDRGVRVTATAAQGRVSVEVDATREGRWETGLELEAHVTTPTGTTVRLPLEARAPGRYEADLSATASGAHLVTVTSPGVGVVGVTGAEVTASSELTSTTGDEALLAELAEATGGRVREGLADVFEAPRRPRTSARALTRPLLAAALAMLLLAVAARRLPGLARWPLAAWWQRRAKAATEAPRDGVDHALEALRARRAKADAAPARTPESKAPTTSSAAPTGATTTTGAKPEGDLDALVAKRRAARRR